MYRHLFNKKTGRLDEIVLSSCYNSSSKDNVSYTQRIETSSKLECDKMLHNTRRSGHFFRTPRTYAVRIGICVAVGFGMYQTNIRQYIDMMKLLNWAGPILKKMGIMKFLGWTEDKQGNIHDIYDLEEIAKDKAWAAHIQHFPCSVQKKHVLELNWEGLESTPMIPDFNKHEITQNKNGTIRVIMKSFFINGSPDTLHHQVAAELQTIAICESSLTKGYTQGSDVGLLLRAPDEVVKEASISLHEFSLKHVKGNVKVKRIPFMIQDVIIVPASSKKNMYWKVKEIQSEFDFKTKVRFKGEVEGIFYDENHNKVANYPISIETILNELPKEIISTDNNDNKIYYIEISGTCSFKYDIKTIT